MDLCFDMMLYLAWVMKILLQVISNVHTGCRFPTPSLQQLNALEIHFLTSLTIQ